METFDELYYKDPYMRSFDATVTSCTPSDNGYVIQLSQTAFYPLGGGQPGDRGTLTWMNNEGEEIVAHIATTTQDTEGSSILHHSDIAVPKGCEVHGEIDWTFRRDNMEGHTGDHIISGIIHTLFGFENIGFHMGERCIEIDYNGILSEKDVLEVERKANTAIREDHRVHALLPTPEELETMNYRSKKPHNGQIRLIEIEGIDMCACSGTHLSSTGQVGLIKVLRISTKKQKTRLELLCGRRALLACEARMGDLRDVSNFLSVADEEVPEKVQRLSEERDTLKHELKAAQHELIDQFVATLKPAHDFVLIQRDGLDIDDLRYMAQQVLSSTSVTTCAALSSATGEQKHLSYVLASTEKDLRPLIKELNSRLNGRGGGKPDMVQGSWSADAAKAKEALRDILA